MQGLEVPLVIQGRLMGRGHRNCLQGRGRGGGTPLPSPPRSAPLAPPAAAGQALEAGDGGWYVVRRRGVVAGAVHPGSCSLKATLGRGGDRERLSPTPASPLKPGWLSIISVPIFRPTQRFRSPGCRVLSRGG